MHAELTRLDAGALEYRLASGWLESPVYVARTGRRAHDDDQEDLLL